MDIEDAKELTKEQLDKLWDFATGECYEILSNSEIGYCKEEKTIVVCCRNCGDYTQVKLED